MQRCCVHKLRNLERKAPKHVGPEIRDDFHRIVYAANADAARAAYASLERTWGKRCQFFTFPQAQWKALRSTNVIERLHQEGQVPATLDNRGADALDGERIGKISGMVR